MSLNIWKTARKHANKQRINDDDILQVAAFPHWIEPLDEKNPQRELRLEISPPTILLLCRRQKPA